MSEEERKGKEKDVGKMTQEQVQEMRRMYGEGATQGALARHFQLGIAQVGRIVRGECWLKGAGLRLPTQAEADAMLGRLLAMQERAREKERLRGEFGEELEVLEGKPPRRAPPPMLLEGGDAPAETEGDALVRLQEEAKGTEQGMDRVLGLTEPGGAYDFVRRGKV